MKSQLYYEVAAWAAHQRDRRIIVPSILRGQERDLWRNGYYTAMNEVAQHFNMQRVKAKQEEESD